MSKTKFEIPTEYVKHLDGLPKVDDAKIADMRNRINAHLNKWADRVQVSMAFTPTVQRVEGERWSEDGKTWEMKNGIKQSISLLESARMPWWCPRCTKAMNHRFDAKFFRLRGWCYNCNIDIEHEMRMNGTWDQWEKDHVRANEIAFLKDKIQEHLDYIRTFKVPQVVFSDGRYEEIAKKRDFEGLFMELLKDVEFMLQRLEQLENENITGTVDVMAESSSF